MGRIIFGNSKNTKAYVCDVYHIAFRYNVNISYFYKCVRVLIKTVKHLYKYLTTPAGEVTTFTSGCGPWLVTVCDKLIVFLY